MTFKRPFRAHPVTPGPVYLSRMRRQRRLQKVWSAILFTCVAAAVFGVGMAITNWRHFSTLPGISRIAGSQFSECVGPVRWNCVVDGDTFWRNGTKIRIADIDTPEVFSPKCQGEYELGMRATHRLRELLNEAPFELQPLRDRDMDSFGRKLRIVVRGGQSVGDQLVGEGLARTWTGRRQAWC